MNQTPRHDKKNHVTSLDQFSHYKLISNSMSRIEKEGVRSKSTGKDIKFEHQNTEISSLFY